MFDCLTIPPFIIFTMKKKKLTKKQREKFEERMNIPGWILYPETYKKGSAGN